MALNLHCLSNGTDWSPQAGSSLETSKSLIFSHANCSFSLQAESFCIIIFSMLNSRNNSGIAEKTYDACILFNSHNAQKAAAPYDF